MGTEIVDKQIFPNINDPAVDARQRPRRIPESLERKKQIGIATNAFIANLQRDRNNVKSVRPNNSGIHAKGLTEALTT